MRERAHMHLYLDELKTRYCNIISLNGRQVMD